MGLGGNENFSNQAIERPDGSDATCYDRIY